METAIGVFTARDHAEEAVKELRQRGLPEEALIFLTRSEGEAKTIGKEFGAYVGGFVGGAAGMTTGVVTAALLLPGVGTVFALGFGAAALLGLAGAGAGASVGSAAAGDTLKPTSESSAEDIAFFQEVLKSGRSLVIVRTDAPAMITAACEVLERRGISMGSKAPSKMQAETRTVNNVTVLDLRGRITVGEGNIVLREMVRELADKGQKAVVLNLKEVNYIDSSGVGELVKAHTTMQNRGGRLKLANLSKRVHDLLKVTRLITIFEIYPDDASAVGSF